MSTEHGDYLVSARGALDEELSRDVTEIVIRERTIGEGADRLEDLARALREEAARYRRLHDGGWRLEAPVRGGQGRCVRGASTEGSGAESTDTSAPGAELDPRRGLVGVLEGVATLPQAAQALERAAQAYEELARSGQELGEPVRDGQVAIAGP